MKLKITVHGVAYEVEVEVLDPGSGFQAPTPLPAVAGAPPRPEGPPAGAGTSGTATPDAPARPAGAAPGAGAPRAGEAPVGGEAADSVASPIAGTVVEVKCRVGESVAANAVLMVIEAMKMNTAITAPVAGKIKTVAVAAGDHVREGQRLVEFE